MVNLKGKKVCEPQLSKNALSCMSKLNFQNLNRKQRKYNIIKEYSNLMCGLSTCKYPSGKMSRHNHLLVVTVIFLSSLIVAK